MFLGDTQVKLLNEELDPQQFHIVFVKLISFVFFIRDDALRPLDVSGELLVMVDEH